MDSRMSLSRLVVAAALVTGLAACSNDPTLNNNSDTSGANVTFQQIDRVGKPGIAELYLPFARHDGFNRAAPQGDVAAYGSMVSSFITTTAGRSAAVAGYDQAILLPDALVANLTDTSGTAEYLGWETGGRIVVLCQNAALGIPTPSGAFGGRSVYDDVVTATLGLTFGTLGTTASSQTTTATPGIPTAVAADDGKEQDGRAGTPQLATDNVACNNTGYQTANFPYLGAPI